MLQFGNILMCWPLWEWRPSVCRKIALVASRETPQAQILYIFNVKPWMSLCRGHKMLVLHCLVHHTFLKGSLWFLSLSFHWSCKLHPLWCNLGMLDICPEPIMNLYFHLEFGFALGDSEGWITSGEGGTPKPWALSLGFVRCTLSQGALLAQEHKIHAERGENGCLKYSIEKIKCSAAALLANRRTSVPLPEIKSVMRWWFCLITMYEIVLLFSEAFTFSYLL